MPLSFKLRNITSTYTPITLPVNTTDYPTYSAGWIASGDSVKTSLQTLPFSFYMDGTKLDKFFVLTKLLLLFTAPKGSGIPLLISLISERKLPFTFGP